MIFFGFGFPYLLVVIMAYVGARVVYTLGTEVTRARELGSYRLEDRLGEGGMGEVWRASHRLLARSAAIKLIRSSAPGNARRHLGRHATAIRAGSAGHRTAPIAAHGDAVRLRRRRGRLVLLRDGAARRCRYRHADQALRPDTRRTRRLHPSTDVPFALRGRIVRARASRHQARKHLPVPVRRRPRLREGSRLRDREGRCTKRRRRRRRPSRYPT